MADDASSILLAYQTIYIAEVNYIAATALFCFDYCLTFGREVDFVWKRGLSVSTVLFYAARYPAFFSTIFVILDIIPFKGMSISSCGILTRIEMALNVILLTAAAVFSSLRVYALWDRNRCVLAAVLLLGMANPAISIYTFATMSPGLSETRPTACGWLSSISVVVYENWIIGTRMASVAADVLVLIATLMRTWSMWAEAARINFTSTFATILMRNGTMYFVVLLAANLIGLGLSRRIELVEPMSTWIAIVTAILTSRFILDLHRAADTLGVAGDGSQGGGMGTLIFRGGESATTTRARSARTREVYGMVFTHATTTIEREDEWDAEIPPEGSNTVSGEHGELIDIGVAA